MGVLWDGDVGEGGLTNFNVRNRGLEFCPAPPDSYIIKGYSDVKLFYRFTESSHMRR